MPGLDNKISNIIGAALPPWLKKQLWTRYTENSLDNRSDDNLIYLANKTAWIRVVSSVNINGSVTDSAQNKDLSLLGDIQYFRDTLGLNNIREPQDLAKQYILFGGTSKYLGATNQSANYQLRSGIDNDGAYAMLGENEVKQYGYRPMPGITSAQIETQGRLGSVRMATIDFKVWDKIQLDIIDTLYFKLGYTMLIEWGNTIYPYKKDNGSVDYQSTEFLSIDPFASNATKESINAQIGINMRKSEGNYDGMLGMVTNFNFTFNQEGGYDCSIKVIGLGSLADSIKINNSKALEEVAKEQIKAYVNLIDKLDAETAAKKAQAQQDLANQQLNQLAEFEKQSKNSLPNYQSLISQNSSQYRYYIDSYGNANNKLNYNIAPFSNYGDVYTHEKLKAIIASNPKYLEGTLVKLDIPRINYIYGSDLIQSFFFGDSIEVNKKNDFYINFTGNVSDNNLKNNGEYETTTISTGIGYGSTFTTLIGRHSKLTYKNEKITQDKLKFVNFTKNPLFTLNFILKDNSLSIDQKLFTTFINKKSYFFVDSPSGDINSFTKFKANDPLVKKLWDDKENIELLYKYFGSEYNNGNSIRQLITKKLDDLETNWKLNSISFPGDSPLPKFSLKLDLDIDIPAFSIEQHEAKYQAGYDNELLVNKVKATLSIILEITDIGLITNILFTQQKPQQSADFEKAQIDQNNQAQISHQVIKPEYKLEEAKTEQVDSALKYQSNLELTLKAIEMHSLNINLLNTHTLTENGSMSVIKLTDEKNIDFLTKIFSNGIYKSFFLKLISGIQDDSNWGIGESYVEKYKNQPDDIKMKVLAKYGFASAILGGNEQGIINSTDSGVPKVNYADLLTSYVIPYNTNDSIDGQLKIVHPVYIQLGFLLMILNDICTMYESGENGESQYSKPLIYIDYNPETNRCLSQPAQFSTNPFDFMIKNQCNVDIFMKLFPESIIDKDNKRIKKSSDPNSTPTNLFDSTNEDIFSKNLPNFREDNDYSGKHMKILISIEYILNIVKEYSKNDGTNSVYLKQFLERICKDMNNYLGAINTFRIAYYDSSNTLSIVDDQIQPLPQGQVPIDKSNINNNGPDSDELPLYGLTSIAKSINIQTEVSSKLGSMIAISANSNSKDQASMGKNASSFGFYNNSYKDRYIPSKTTATNKTIDEDTKNKKDSSLDSLISAANLFNNTIRSFYGSLLPSKDNVAQATNFYIDSLSKLQNEIPATRASVMIPVSVTFTTDGISGFHMGSAFTIPEKMLPYTYSVRKTPEMREGRKVGFASVGVSHAIANNTWETSIKGQMIFLKDANDFSGAQLNSTFNKQISQLNNTDTKTGRSNNNPIVDRSKYSNIKFINGTDKEQINPNLLKDINIAAINNNFTVTVSTALQHDESAKSGYLSRHKIGNAVDITYINTEHIGPSNFKTLVDPFVNSLNKLGYTLNSESGNLKAVLQYAFSGGGHNDHIHVSNNIS